MADLHPYDDPAVRDRMIRAARRTCRRLNPTGWRPSELVVAAMLESALLTARQITDQEAHTDG